MHHLVLQFGMADQDDAENGRAQQQEWEQEEQETAADSAIPEEPVTPWSDPPTGPFDRNDRSRFLQALDEVIQKERRRRG